MAITAAPVGPLRSTLPCSVPVLVVSTEMSILAGLVHADPVVGGVRRAGAGDG